MSNRRHVRLAVVGLGAVGLLLAGTQVSEAQRRGQGSEGRNRDDSRGGGGMRSGGGARGDTGGARTSGNGGNRAPHGGSGAARTSVNRDFDNAQLNQVATASTTNRQLVHDGSFDLDVDVDARWHPAAHVATWPASGTSTAAAIGSIAYVLPPSCTMTHVNALSYYLCGLTWYQPQFAGTSVRYVVVAEPGR